MKIFFDTIGCRLNQAEIESLARQFRAAGHEIIGTSNGADLAIINTCTVTNAAAADSRSAIRRVNRTGVKEILVTGCLATVDPRTTAALPGVNRVIPNSKKSTLASDYLGMQQKIIELEPIARIPIPGIHARTRAFIKVQDGCDNACTYCISTVARGASRSRSLDEIITEIQAAALSETKEVVLTGVHLGAWGLDLPEPLRLNDLVIHLLEKTDVPRIRLSSIEPWDLDKEFFSLWDDRRLCRHLHLPLQSGSNTVLKRMGRKVTPESFSRIVESARAKIPDVSITTDMITGFPGETDAEFKETLDFVNRIRFSGGHVFTYSARTGTPAARMKDQVPFEIRKERNGLLRDLFEQEAKKYQSKFLDRALPVLWEVSEPLTDSEWKLGGLTDNYIRVRAKSLIPKWNTVDQVRMVSLEESGINGEICI